MSEPQSSSASSSANGLAANAYLDHPVEWLRTIYQKRKWQNPRYSMRAFAKALDINSGRLSEILSHKRTLTTAMGEKIVGALKLDGSQAKQFKDLIRNEKQHRQSLKSLDRAGAQYHVKTLDIDQFHLISDWQHFAILALMRTCDFRNDMRWMAQRLGLTLTNVSHAIKRLSRLGLVKQENSTWAVTEQTLATPRDIASLAIRKAHKQNLQKAQKALDEVPVEKRDFSSITMAIDIEKLSAAKEYIQEFRRRMASLLETEQATEVYNLNIQLFPLSQSQDGFSS